ncbi:acetate/propionate family kinase [Halovulum dunhuangense]|uniref:Acetate kinase n=1 Tax=Halovulum dunhuangense TaxID=1505036 RepID=A0A849L7K9_9RHOB|nr:acetate/propionate family kinase [Halovulum dunhuangense]NNU82080.1 acetate/propionate family kinase [Halovulum dunhuangense]
MTDALLALNAGSSSLKFALAEVARPGRFLVWGGVERVGRGDAVLTLRAPEQAPRTRRIGPADHVRALRELCAAIPGLRPGLNIRGVGHRIVHGGARFSAPVRVTPDVVAALAALVPLAPLHQPHGLQGIESGRTLFPEAVHVACFDTAFHAGKPWVQDAYALPARYYDAGIRRYGFHGLACESVCRALESRGYPVAEKAIAIAHLGNGCSVSAVRAGRSVGTSMGFTALDGLAMGTRCGRIDPGVLLHLMREGHDADALERLLYHESGLLGLSGISGDMRDLAAAGTPAARRAVAYFVTRVIEEVCRMAGVMGGLDAIVFSGGIGENAADIRQAVADGLAFLPGEGGRGPTVMVVAANEEERLLAAARDFLP